MMVQAVCLPVGSKMLVIPIFFPIIPFIFLTVFPRKVVQDRPAYCKKIGLQSWFITDLFLFFGSTDDKQTSKGLFLCCPPKGKNLKGDPEVLIFLTTQDFRTRKYFFE